MHDFDAEITSDVELQRAAARVALRLRWNISKAAGFSVLLMQECNAPDVASAFAGAAASLDCDAEQLLIGALLGLRTLRSLASIREMLERGD